MIMAAISSKAAGSTKSATRKNAQVQTRGIRNNNPLNIRHSTNKWQGMAPSQSDRAFVQFTARKYIGLHHANTMGKIIARWAPSSDGNNTQAYIRFVSKTSGIKPDTPLRFADQKSMVAIVRSMAQMESAIIEDEALLNEAYCMAQG